MDDEELIRVAYLVNEIVDQLDAMGEQTLAYKVLKLLQPLKSKRGKK